MPRRGWLIILSAMTLLAPWRASASRECHPAADGLVCGFHCLRSVAGHWSCANTPAGSCQHEPNGQIACTAEPVPAPKRRQPLLQQAQCLKGRDGHVACGYGCFENIAGHPICAQTPEGVCILDEERVLCSEIDASPWVVPSAAAACMQDTQGRVACGYHCALGAEGYVRCAQTPDGACAADDFGKVVCTDFTPDSRVVALRELPPPVCESVDGGRPVCGYHCLRANTGAPMCATTPDGTCAAGSDGAVTCTQYPPATRTVTESPATPQGQSGR